MVSACDRNCVSDSGGPRGRYTTHLESDKLGKTTMPWKSPQSEIPEDRNQKRTVEPNNASFSSLESDRHRHHSTFGLTTLSRPASSWCGKREPGNKKEASGKRREDMSQFRGTLEIFSRLCSCSRFLRVDERNRTPLEVRESGDTLLSQKTLKKRITTAKCLLQVNDTMRGERKQKEQQD